MTGRARQCRGRGGLAHAAVPHASFALAGTHRPPSASPPAPGRPGPLRRVPAADLRRRLGRRARRPRRRGRPRIYTATQYMVRHGDDLWTIAATRYGATVDLRRAVYVIREANQLDGSAVEPGRPSAASVPRGVATQGGLPASRLRYEGHGVYLRGVRDVAQPGSAPALGAGGREFKSRRPDQPLERE